MASRGGAERVGKRCERRGLEQVGAGSGGDGLRDQVFLSGQDDRACSRRERSQTADGLDAWESGKLKLDDRQIGGEGASSLERLLAALRLDHDLDARADQDLGRTTPGKARWVDDERAGRPSALVADRL